MKAQLQRSWRLGLLARDMARVRLGQDPATTERARRDLVERMGSLHGLPQKIGQILSLSELTEDDKTYTALTEGAASVPPAEAFRQIESELGRPLEDCFAEIDPAGISASLGQVHRARLHNGKEVAVKFRYRGISQTISQDLRALGWLTAPMGGLRRGFDVKDYQHEVGAMLASELDYENEARMLQTFGHFTSDWTGVEVPRVEKELTHGGVLTMSWIEGTTVEEARRWAVEDRRVLAENLLRLFLTSSLRWGYLHSDPHPGNYRFLHKDGRPVIGLLDFGCVKRLDRETVARLGDLLQDSIDGRLSGDADRAKSRFVALGFKPDALEPLRDRLPPLCEILFEPFRRHGRYRLDDWNLAQRTEEALGELRWNFRFAGPANLIYFMRAYQGVIQYLDALGVAVDWRRELEASWHRSGAAAAPAPIPAREERPPAQSESLNIQVREDGRMKVQLMFLPHLAADLLEFLPPEVEEKCRDRCIDVAAISRRAAESGFAPAELFSLEEENKCIRIWLE